MADYYNPEQLAQRLGIAEDVLAELESKGLLQPKLKRGMRFFSSRQAHDLRVALRLSTQTQNELGKSLCEGGRTAALSGQHGRKLGSEFMAIPGDKVWPGRLEVESFRSRLPVA